MKKVAFFGKIELVKGKPKLTLTEDHVAQIIYEKLGGECLVRLTVSEDDKGKDSRLQAYYWKIVLEDIAAGMRDLGNDWTKQEAHDKLKEMFAPKIRDQHTTKQMSAREFKEYVERCIRFAAEFLSITVRTSTREGLLPKEER